MCHDHSPPNSQNAPTVVCVPRPGADLSLSLFNHCHGGVVVVPPCRRCRSCRWSCMYVCSSSHVMYMSITVCAVRLSCPVQATRTTSLRTRWPMVQVIRHDLER